jgi:hypothetical protein
MSELDSLPPEQRAALSLILDDGKGYAEAAHALSVSERKARRRAHTALDTLARSQANLQTTGQDRPGDSPDEQSGSTKGAIVVGLVLGSIAAAVILISNHGSGGSTPHSPPAPTRGRGASAATGGLGLGRIIRLTPGGSARRAKGAAYVISHGARPQLYLEASGLAVSPGSSYGLWLLRSTSSATRLGPTMTASRNGTIQGSRTLPADTSNYHELLITHETDSHPSHPGPIALSGRFAVR